jgi:hypothetical protein
VTASASATEQPTKTGTATTPKPTAAPVDIQPIRLRARVVAPDLVSVTWTGTPAASRYLLVATVSRDGPAPDPTYPGAKVMGDFTHPPVSPLRIRVPAGVVEIRFRVIAFRADGKRLTRSNVVTVTLPGG